MGAPALHPGEHDWRLVIDGTGVWDIAPPDDLLVDGGPSPDGQPPAEFRGQLGVDADGTVTGSGATYIPTDPDPMVADELGPGCCRSSFQQEDGCIGVYRVIEPAIRVEGVVRADGAVDLTLTFDGTDSEVTERSCAGPADEAYIAEYDRQVAEIDGAIDQLEIPDSAPEVGPVVDEPTGLTYEFEVG